MRTLRGVNMCGARLWLAAVALQTLLLAVNCGHHRRSMPNQAAMSKSGWRPVVGSSGLLYSFNGASAYKIPVPVYDVYQSSARPVSARDVTKLTSIAQSYRPTTLRTVPSAPPANQPINTYHNPFAYNNHQFSYKYVQNIPLDSSLIRNPHNHFAAHPAFSKYPNKFKQQAQNNVLQQLTSIQPIHFGQYQTAKPLDIFGKPIEQYVRPNDVRKPLHQTTMEVFKPEVFKLPDSDTASQSVNQQVKTAQQQGLVASQGQVFNPYPQYSFQDAALPPSILGSFGTYGVQSVKGRDPGYPGTKTTFAPPQQTKQTIFNSFSYNPNYKSTTAQVISTTPRYQTTASQTYFGSTFSDFKITPAPHTKFSTAPKIDPNAGVKDGFKPSPQDPFTKHYQNDFNKLTVTTYNPVQTTTLANSYFDYSFPSQQNSQLQTFYDEQNSNFNYEKKKQKIHDNVASGVNQQNKHYTNPPPKTQSDDTLSAPFRATYEVVETTEPDVASRPSTMAWPLTSQSYNYGHQQATEQTLKKQEYETAFSKPTTTPLPELPEEYAIVTEAEKGYANSLSYDSEVESQSRRPLGDDFEPIGKNKLNDYYYKVSTPAYNDYSARRTKKPNESSRLTAAVETTTRATKDISDIPIETLPTLPPNQHFKRPTGSSEPLDKDKIRKRNKIRRRRPIANGNRNKDRIVTETSTHASTVQTTETTQITENQEIHTIRPRVRPTNSYQSNPTTPSVTTDLTTSALPTVFPTAPTIVKKKLIHRRLPTTTEREEATTIYFKDETNKDSQIMKISNRPYITKPTSTAYELRTSDTPDYTHKQDEKDTPTSDVDVSLSDTYKTSVEDAQEFSFHKDVKPIEAKLEPVTSQRYRETTTESTSDIEVTTTPRLETSSNGSKGNRTRLRNKYNRPRFSVKDYRNRIGSTTSTDNPGESTPKVRFPQRRVPISENADGEITTERKRFTPKDPRHKLSDTENNEEKEKEIHSIRNPNRHRQTTVDNTDGTTQKISSRIRNGLRRPRPTEESIEVPTTVHSKRPLRKKIKDSEIGESVDIAVTETTVYDVRNDITSERSRSESAIMKIADKKHHDHVEHLFEHSKRVSDLTLAASKDYNKPGMFKTVASSSRRIPNYFTIATDDPILPIEAFFPQLNQKKDV